MDERRSDGYNWGYDPVNYNVPEGSYATDAYHGQVRVAELKQTVKALHDNGISVVMDVVYNHVYDASGFCYNRIIPGYFSRPGANGSGCGNDTASERSMVRKYIVDSVCYWASQYHVDGFRFDLVGLLDVDTVNAIVEAVHSRHPNVIFYGEGWTMPTAVTKPNVKMATQRNSALTPGFAYFNDTLRDALKGSVFDGGKGYVSGAPDKAEEIARCFSARPGWSSCPGQIINYTSCHDNHTLIDRITLSTPGASRQQRVRMNCLAAAICLTSQGVPFLHGGEEMLRSKPLTSGKFDGNSYRSPDSVNAIRWDTLSENACAATVRYYKGLIAFRKAHAALRMTQSAAVDRAIRRIPVPDENVTAFRIDGRVAGDRAEELIVIFNPNPKETTVSLPEGVWAVCVEGDRAGTDALRYASGQITVEPISAAVLTRE